MANPSPPGTPALEAEASIVAHETRIEQKTQSKRFTVRLARGPAPPLLLTLNAALQVFKVVVNGPSQKWAIYRRYNDFYNLHQKVRAHCAPSMRCRH